MTAKMTAKGKSRGQNWSEHETQAVILVKDWLLFLTQSTLTLTLTLTLTHKISKLSGTLGNATSYSET